VIWSALFQRGVLLKRVHCLYGGEDWASQTPIVWADRRFIGHICKITATMCLVVHVQYTATLLSWVGTVTCKLV